jgi:hypothetical protein
MCQKRVNQGRLTDFPHPKQNKKVCFQGFPYGASRTRTGDLLGAIQALSHLSYSPARVSV